MFLITRAVFCQPITFLSVLHSAGDLQPKLGSSHLRGKYKLSQLTDARSYSVINKLSLQNSAFNKRAENNVSFTRFHLCG